MNEALPPNSPAGGPAWERGVIEKLALAHLAEQRSQRRWKYFFRLAWLSFAFLLLAAVMGWVGRGGVGKERLGVAAAGGRHTALVDLNGLIAPGTLASAERINNALQGAFDDSRTAGVILRINSPGGSPVQAGQVVDEIRRLRAAHPSIKVYAVIEDICASGGYYVASAADEIYVDQASLVGSIGVIMDGFGVTGAMEKLGVERRAVAAGDNKTFLDPFAPANPAHVAHAHKLLADVHQQFVDTVRKGRGARLKETPELFSGLIWTGRESIVLGLADKIGSVEHVARDVIQAERIMDFTMTEDYWHRLSRQFGVAVGQGMSGALAKVLAEKSIALR